MDSPCDTCRHYGEEQIEQFSYVAYCAEDAPGGVYMSKWGCYRYEKRKGDD